MNRFAQRYGATIPQRICSTPTCSNTAQNLAGRCYRCTNNLRRHGDCLQEMMLDSELAPYIRRAETQRARHQHLDVPALQRRWDDVVASCRGNATPSYREQGRLTFNVQEREACALVRDFAEAEGMAFERALDLMTALHLITIERPAAFRSEDAFKAVTVETFRRAANVGRRWAPIRSGMNYQQSYRKEVARAVRLATYRYLNTGLGAASLALARREAAREEQAKATRADYWQAVNAIAAE
jgi:hypothetical protein